MVASWPPLSRVLSSTGVHLATVNFTATRRMAPEGGDWALWLVKPARSNVNFAHIPAVFGAGVFSSSTQSVRFVQGFLDSADIGIRQEKIERDVIDMCCVQSLQDRDQMWVFLARAATSSETRQVFQAESEL